MTEGVIEREISMEIGRARESRQAKGRDGGGGGINNELVSCFEGRAEDVTLGDD